MSVPYVDTGAAERLFRHRVIRLLQDEGLLDEDRTRLLLSWNHSGFRVISFITEPRLIRRIPDHLADRASPGRAPPLVRPCPLAADCRVHPRLERR